MSQTPCETCTRLIGDGATICAGCAHRLDAALADVCGYQGLAYDLDVALALRTHLHLSAEETAEEKRVPGVLPANPLPYSPRVSKVAKHLRGVLVSWAKLVIEETGAGTVLTPGPACLSCQHPSCREIRTQGLPADTITGIAAWLRPRVGWLRHHEIAAEAYEEITEAVHEARRAVDRRAERLYAGPCDCGDDMYARPGAAYVSCTNPVHGEHGATWKVEDRRSWMLRSAEDMLATATQMARLITYLGISVPAVTIRSWANRGRIVAHGRDANGNPMYRLGDVVHTYYTPGTKASA